MSNIYRRTQRRARGFTLIELMLVVVVIGILAAIAYPSYQGQMQRARRADGKSALMQVAQQLQRCHTVYNRFDHADCEAADALPIDSPDGFYSIDGDIDRNNFTLTATPQNAQADDTKCGKLGLTSTGVQTSLGGADDAAGCW